MIVGRRVAEPIEAARRRQLEFTADASHELRTPLSVIEAHTSLALAQERDAAWYRGAFGRVDRESKRMRRLLEDMLWLARFDAAAAPRDHGARGPRRARRAGRRSIRGRRGDAAPPPRRPRPAGAGPRRRVRRTCWTGSIGVLLDNACKYAPEEGTVDVTVAAEGTRVTVTVDDSGPGIAAEDEARIFDRFHRSVTTSSEAGGAGLGLAIGDAIVRATGGRWTVGRSPRAARASA